MSAKPLYSLSDDKKSMKNQSQMSCMNGLFQLFDRHHFMGSRRVSHKRLPPPVDNQQTQMAMENASYEAKIDNSKQDTKDRHKVSCESPRATDSSTTCSSTQTFSNYVKTPSMIQAEYSQSPKVSKGSDHLRDIVKESINREVPGLLVKTPVGKGIRNVVKHIDSPRPSLPLTPIKPKSSGLDESFKKLRGFQEIHNEGKDRSLLMTRREGHRLSCDGRVTNSQETLKSTLKLKEQPRLSLDSRASSARRKLENDNYMSPKLEKPDNRNHTSIVAKLMGLDITTESTITSKSSESNETSNPESGSEQTIDSGICEDPIKNTMQFRNQRTTMKPISASRLLVEPAPRKDASSSWRKSGFGEATKNIPNLMPSVYGEMEKRVTELEFTQSSSDLRALKQILGAMQKSKDSLQIKKELASDSVSQSSNESILSRSHFQDRSGNVFQSVKIERGRQPKKNTAPALLMKSAHSVKTQQMKQSAECTAESFSGLQKLKTPDAGRQNKESTEKYMPSGRTLRDASSPTLCTDSNSFASPRTDRLKNSKLAQPQATEKNIATRSSGIVSPRLQQRRLRSDKKVQQTSLPSESTIMKEQPTDADSPATRIQLASRLQRPYGKLADVRIKSFSSIQLDYSSRSDRNISQSSRFVTEGTNMTDLDMIEASFFWKRDIKQNNKSARSDKCRAIAEINIIAPEQPSPVSVLDAMFYREESPSPVKKISNVFIDEESFNQEEQVWATKHGQPDSTTSLASTETDYDKERVYNREELSEEQLDFYSSTVGKSTDCYSPVGDVKEQEFIFENLLASDLFQKAGCALKTIQPHQSGYSVRPDTFNILEMNNAKQDSSVNTLKNNTVSKQLGHADAKLIFDIVNEILSSKLIQSNYNELLSSRVADKSQAKQKLLKDIQINKLQVTQSNCNYEECLKSIMLDGTQKHGPNGSEFQVEISALVLDVERLIFKDLISEIIYDAAEGPIIRYNGHCRQLFGK